MGLNFKKSLKLFFDRFYKDQHPETALRYLPVVSEISNRKLQNAKILEVGSGSLGITPYLKKPIDGLDLDFSGPQTEFLTKIKGSLNDLPFRKNSYDVVICVDTLEHLPKNDRENAVYEIFRVAKRLAIIVVPIGNLSQDQDKDLNIYYQKVFGTIHQFLSEHVQNGLPTTNEILVLFDQVSRKLNKKVKVSSRPLLNLKVREIIMKTWISKSRFLYYLYLKGYLIFLPILRLANWGNCYRRIFVVEFTPQDIK